MVIAPFLPGLPMPAAAPEGGTPGEARRVRTGVQGSAMAIGEAHSVAGLTAKALPPACGRE